MTRKLTDWINAPAQLMAKLPEDVIALITRFGVAAIFFSSARTKVDGLLHISDGTYVLFEQEYALPLIPPHAAAVAATVSEHLFSILLVLGLFTRYSALAFLGMTAVIEIFVYPDAWPTHLSWAGLLIYLIGRGGGAYSLDRRLGLI
ncbi:DoxX family protein [Asticcacaulis excentricus]|uniref:Integral membrane protein, rhomboid family n=1 Tax=Asticcacaulis excentricus TaxID=78587 RepID=A0A3G9G9H7_9CAUL|nr:DoxX family protein [Asticcacaulis excentricus]BBF82591.1 integral membrane protein, rhomboid family [Asticcacaulis excentricus]